MRVFNAFQCVLLFAAGPHVIGWLASNPFPYAPAAFWSGIVIYALAFVGMVASTTHSFHDIDW